MADRAQVTGDKQAAPPLTEGRPVVTRETRGVSVLVLRNRQRADQEETWHPERAPGEMASETVVVPLQRRSIAGLLLETVEDDALTRVFSSHLDHAAAANVTDSDGIIEEQRSRVPHVDERTLRAILREKSHLRLDRNRKR